MQHAGSVVEVHQLYSAGSVVVVAQAELFHGMWDFSDQGLIPHPLHWEADSQPLDHHTSPLITVSDSSLVMYRKETDFCLLISYHATLLNSIY